MFVTIDTMQRIYSPIKETAQHLYINYTSATHHTHYHTHTPTHYHTHTPTHSDTHIPVDT